MANVVVGAGAEDGPEALGALQALGAETIAARRLLAVADEVDGGRRSGDRGEEEDELGLHVWSRGTGTAGCACVCVCVLGRHRMVC